MSRRKTGWRIAGIALVVELILLALTATSLYLSRDKYEKQVALTTANLALVVGESVDNVFEKFHLQLESLATDVERQIAHGGLDKNATQRYLEKSLVYLPEAGGFGYANENGDVLAGSGSSAPVNANLADRSYFIALKTNPQLRFTISEPVLGKFTKRWIIISAIRLNNSDGKFAGIVYCSIELSTLSELFNRVMLGPRGVINLRSSADSSIILRHPEESNAGSSTIGQKSVPPALKKMLDAGMRYGTFTTTETIDNVERTVSFKFLQRHPYYVLIGEATNDYLKPWREEVRNCVILVFVLSALIGLVSFLLFRSEERRQKTLSHLLTQEERNRAVIASLAEGIVVRDSNGKIIDCNASAERIFGKPLADLQGVINPIAGWPVYREDGTPMPVEEFRFMRVLATGQTQPAQVIRLQRPNGQTVWIQKQAQPIHDDFGVMSGVVSSIIDVTDSRSAAELRTARDAAEQANKTKTTFLASMSHELRTPLNSIMGFAQLLAQSPEIKASEKLTKKVAHILAAGKLLLNMVEQVLDLSSIETGNIGLAVEMIDLTTLVKECAIENEAEANKRSIVINDGHLAQGAWIQGNRKRIKQAITNLVSNAIKYNKVGGRVDLETESNGQQIRFAVRDTGPGLSEEQQGQLFTAFNRLGAENSAVEGAGIGLLITKRIIEASGGSIAVSSTQGKGSTFTVLFPSTKPTK